MKKGVLISFLLSLQAISVLAQSSTSPQATITSAAASSTISLTPEMSASSVSSVFAALASSSPQDPSNPLPGDPSSSPGGTDTDAGASGSDHESITLSRGGLIAIIVIIVVVAVVGISSSVLWYLAKKRSWEVRKTIRRSARRVATALTPKRSTFPKDVHRRSTRGLTRIDEIPPTPKFYAQNSDIEKADGKPLTPFEMSEPPKSKWSRKLGR